MKHLISTKDIETKDLFKLFDIADHLNWQEKPLKDKIIATLFYEPSTRTRFSFESAMMRLGGQVISLENAGLSSSALKGESLEDTIRIVNNYADAIVLRHFEAGAAEKAAKISKIPIINAGDGINEHPTQAVIDAYTIHKRLNKLKGLSIAFVGDIKNGRTVHSLFYLMNKFKNKFYYPEKIGEIIESIDILYMTRIQKERFTNESEYQKAKDDYVLTLKLLSRMKPNAMILHPLPRLNEVPKEIDEDPRASYFEQAANGLKIRAAILQDLLEN